MEPDDAGLVAAVLAGDRDAFALVYDRYADRLHDFCWGILRDRDEAADATHDTFLRAAERLGQLRDPAKLRGWLYAVARHESFRRLRSRSRTRPADEVADMAATGASPEEAASQAELAALVWSAAQGLDERDRTLLELSVRQGLDHDEVAVAVGVSAAHASVLLNRMRERVRRSLGALVLARSGARRDCPELGRLLHGWDGAFSVRLRKRVARHAETCETCGERLRGALDPAALFGMAPALAAPAALRDRVLTDPVLVSHLERLGPAPGAGGGGGGSGGARGPSRGSSYPPPLQRATARRGALVAALLLLLLGAGGTAWVGGTRQAEDVGAFAAASPSPSGTDELAGDERASPAPHTDGAPAPTPPPTPTPSMSSPAATDPAEEPSPAPSAVATGAGASTAPPAPAAPRSPSTTPTSGGAATTPPSPGPPAPTEPPALTSEPTPVPTTPTPEPVLRVPVTAIDLGTSRDAASLELYNVGDAPLSWTAGSSGTGLTLGPTTGTIPADGLATVQLALERGELPEGAFALGVAVRSDGGDAGVTVTGRVGRPPEILRIASSATVLYPAGSLCRQQVAQVTAAWSDESPAVAVLHWTGPDGRSGSTAMDASGPEGASTTLGPFATTGTVGYRVEVTDEHGNAATSGLQRLPVDRCARTR